MIGSSNIILSIPHGTIRPESLGMKWAFAIVKRLKFQQMSSEHLCWLDTAHPASWPHILLHRWGNHCTKDALLSPPELVIVFVPVECKN